MINACRRSPKIRWHPPAQDNVEEFLAEQKAIEDRRQELIKELLREKDAAIKAFDEKLAKLGYEENHRTRRSHHKKSEDKKTG